MNDVVSLDQLLNIRNTMQSIASKNETINLLLNKTIIKQCNVIDIKKKLINLFSKFKSFQYYYTYPIENVIKISANYDLHQESFSQRNNSSQVENAVQRYLDKKILTTNIYNSLMIVSYKLTHEEIVYLVNTFFTHKSEEDISEILGFSKTYLQQIKKSCIVKMWIELEQYCTKDD